jgi:DNA-directed RNA polymerase subunit M/transcription elongation factor TFIIS
MAVKNVKIIKDKLPETSKYNSNTMVPKQSMNNKTVAKTDTKTAVNKTVKKTIKVPKIKKVTFDDCPDKGSDDKGSDDKFEISESQSAAETHCDSGFDSDSFSDNSSSGDSDFSDQDDDYVSESDSEKTTHRIIRPLIKKNIVKNPDKDHISNFDMTAELMSMFNFRTSASSCIRDDVMLFAVKNLDRKNAIMALANFLPVDLADKVEQGILEYSMIQISNENPDVVHFLSNTYQAVVNDICVNLDVNNLRIDNQTLTPSLIDGGLDPRLVAFMTPQQIHPARWSKLLEQKKIAEDADNNKKVTDIYKCKKCFHKKTSTFMIQLRSSDEPMTIFVTCLVCYNTFTTQ